MLFLKYRLPSRWWDINDPALYQTGAAPATGTERWIPDAQACMAPCGQHMTPVEMDEFDRLNYGWVGLPINRSAKSKASSSTPRPCARSGFR